MIVFEATRDVVRCPAHPWQTGPRTTTTERYVIERVADDAFGFSINDGPRVVFRNGSHARWALVASGLPGDLADAFFASTAYRGR